MYVDAAHSHSKILLMKQRLLALAAIALIVAGCSTIQQLRLEEPEIEFKGFSFDSITFEDLTLMFEFEVDNPNDRDFTMTGYDYDLLLEGNSLSRGEREEEMTIRKNGKSLVVIPVTFTHRQLAEGFGELLGNSEVAYEFRTEVNLDLGSLGSRTVPVAQKGELPIPTMPHIRFGGFEVNEIGFSGVDVELNFRVRNPNAFGFYVSGLDYTLIVDGNEWVSAGLDESYHIEESRTSVFTIPVNIGLSKAGTDVMRVMREREPVEYQIRGNASVEADLPGFERNADLPFEFNGIYEF